MELKAPLGTGLGSAGCSGCGEVFTTVRAFDKHQTFRGGFRCLPPASVGLELKASGRWGFPAPAEWPLEGAAVSESRPNGARSECSDAAA